MSKNAKTLLRSLERCHKVAAEHRSTIKAALNISNPVEMEACQSLLNELSAYLRANQKMQMAIASGYGETPRQIATASIKSKQLN